MKNTYINEQDLVNYPFAEGQNLPFPRHAVSALQVAFRNAVQTPAWSISDITVTGVELGNNVLTLAITANNDKYLGRLSAKSDSVASFSVTVDGIAIHAILETGNLKGIDPMSAACALKLDPSCVLPCTWLHNDNYQGYMVINGYTYPIGECLDIKVAGELTVKARTVWTEDDGQSPSHQMTNIIYEDVEGWLEAGAGSFASAQLGTYDMVTSINGIPVRSSASEEYAPKLEFRVVPLDTEPSSLPTLGRIKFSVQNGVPADDISDDPESIGPGVVPRGFNDTMGNATILSVIGGPQIPNCYVDNDQSGEPDAITVN